MPEDQVTTTTPRRRSRRSETSDEMRQLPLADQASAADNASDGAAATPAKPARRRAAKVTEPVAQQSAADAAVSIGDNGHADVHGDDHGSDTPRNGGRGPRVSRPRASRRAASSGTPAAPVDEIAPVTLEAPVAVQHPEVEASVAPKQSGRSRGRRGFAHGVATTTEIRETASGVHVIREMPRGDSTVDGTVESTAAPAGEGSAEAPAETGSVARSPYRFPRARRGAAAQSAATSANGAGPEASATPPAGESATATPSDRGEQDERVTPSDVVVRPLRRSWGAQEGREGRDTSPYSGRDRATPHIPGGNDPYQRRGGDQGHAQGQPQHPSRPSANRPGYQRGQNAPASQRGSGAPYNPGAGGQGGQDQRPGAPGYDRPPYGQRGEVPPYAPYNPYEPYPGYPTAPQQGTSHERPGRGRGYPQQPGYPGGYPGYGEQQRGGRAGGRTAGDYYTPNTPRDRRGYSERGDRRNTGGNTGRGANRPGRDRDAFAPPAAPAYAPGEGRYTNGRQAAQAVAARVDVSGLLWLGGGSGMSPAELLDSRTLQPIGRVNMDDVRRLGLRSGDLIAGQAEERGGRRIVVAVETLNGQPPEDLRERPQFESLTASFPDRRIRLEHAPQPISVRIIDLFAPLGFGSRALVVAPPKTGKTTLIREAAESVLTGYPDAVVMAVLVGERPEEVTDLRARLEPRGGLVYAASFDEDTQRHAWLVQVAVERAKRVAESGRDAFMVLDSLTRLARAENLASRGAGRTLSGGIDAQALDTGRRAFGAARNLEEGGSITILATCLVDTGSRQDEVVYEEFKGTGNMELHLSRELSQRRLFPAVDAIKSGTRREEMLLTPEELRASTALRRRLADLPPFQATEQLLKVMERTQSNAALLQAIEQSGWMTAAR